MKTVLRYFAAKTLSEQINPDKKGFFQKRIVEDSLARYYFASRYTKKRSVLDIACGEGYGSYFLSKTAKKVLGVDVSESIINDATVKYNTDDSKIEFKCAEAIDYLSKTKLKFDVIVSFETIEHVRDYLQLIKLFDKCLKKGGVLVVSTPNKKFSDFFFGETANPYHVKEFYTQELADILTAVFHAKPKIYRQRPVSKNRLLLSTIKSLVLSEKSSIATNKPLITGIDNIYVIKKKI